MKGDPTPIWVELAVKYNVPEFGAKPLPLPTFADEPTEAETDG